MSKDTNNNDNIDYLLDNIGTLGSGVKQAFSHARDVWDIIPDLLFKFYEYLQLIIKKIMFRMRAYMVNTMSEDMKHLNEDKKIWNNITTEKIKYIKLQAKTKQEKDICSLLKYYVKNNKKDKFLEFCITQQKNKNFKNIRKKLLNNKYIDKKQKPKIKIIRKNNEISKLDKLLNELSMHSEDK